MVNCDQSICIHNRFGLEPEAPTGRSWQDRPWTRRPLHWTCPIT